MPIFDSDTCCNFQATDQYGGPAELTKNNIHVGLTDQNSRYIPTKLLCLEQQIGLEGTYF